jgi:hypothetical protein
MLWLVFPSLTRVEVRSSAAWHMSTGPCDTVGDVLQRIEEDTIDEFVRSGHAEGPQSLVDIPMQLPVMYLSIAARSCLLKTSSAKSRTICLFFSKIED